MEIQLALYQPDIPQNTGALLRLGACLQVPVHIIHPAGFILSTKTLKRAGMDYLDHVEMVEHDSFADFDLWRRSNNRRLVLLSTKSRKIVYDFAFSRSDILLMGRESAGVPDEVRRCCDHSARLPMAQNMRSINVALAAAMAIGEAMRQSDGFKNLS